ncbi:MAG: hypothetical protein EXR51_07870 [Dehalococcoidia bacterium]|nr:hypothetical protein [Dehalococcoidia bacterium]
MRPKHSTLWFILGAVTTMAALLVGVSFAANALEPSPTPVPTVAPTHQATPPPAPTTAAVRTTPPSARRRDRLW